MEWFGTLARLVTGEHDVSHRDRAGINKRIARNAFLELKLDDGIERCGGGFSTDTLP